MRFSRTRTLYIGVIVTGLVLYFPKLGRHPMELWDEAIYANAARNAVRNGDWLIPHLYRPVPDYVPFFDKPPLWIWAEALSMSIFGVNPFAARLPNALATITLAVLIAHMGRTLYSNTTGGVAAAIFLLAPPVYLPGHSGRSASLDIPLILFGSLFVWLVWQYPRSPRELTIAGAAAGLAVLVKGVAAGPFALIAAGIIAYNWPKYQIRGLVRGVAVTIAVVLPWSVWAYIQYPDELLWGLILKQLQRSSGDLGAFGFAPPLFDFMNYPYFKLLTTHWKYSQITALAIVGFLLTAARDRQRETAILFLWATGFIGFFVVTGGNHQWYILPVVVPFAVFAGRIPEHIIDLSSGVWTTFHKKTRAPSKRQQTIALLIVMILCVGPLGTVSFSNPPAKSWTTAQYDAATEIPESGDTGAIYIHENVSIPTYTFVFYANRDVRGFSGESFDGMNGEYALVPPELAANKSSQIQRLSESEDFILVRVE